MGQQPHFGGMMSRNRAGPASGRPVALILALLMAGYVIFFSTQLLLHYYSFGSRALDLGNMDQAIWNTSQGRLFHQTNQPGLTNRLSLHVEPILLPISLLYHLYSGPEILFIFQSIIVALGAIPVFALARFKLKSEPFGLVFALVYLMFPAIQGASLLDFHAVTLAPTFLLAAFYYLETGRAGRFGLFAVLAAACKEDMTLSVLMMGLYAFFINRQRRLGLATVALSGIWGVLAVFVIPPVFAGTGNIHWDRYGHLGDGAVEIVLNLFRAPHLYLEHLRRVDAVTYLRLLLMPTAWIALFNPITLLLALPSLGINLLSSFPPMQRVNSLIYAAPVVPAVLISSIYGVANLNRAGRWLGQRMGGRVSFLRSFATKGVPTALAGLILIATLAYHGQYGYLPGGGQFRGWETVTEHHRRATRIFEQIPAEAALSAQDRLNPHVSQRETLYIFDRIDNADHIVLDVTEDSWPLHPVELRHRVDQLLVEDFGIVAALDGYLLLAKAGPTADQPELATTLPDEFFDFARVPEPERFEPQVPVSVTFADKIELLGYELSLGAHEQFLPVITLYWRALQPLQEDYALWPFFIDRQGHLIEDPDQRPLVTTLWYPTSNWSTDEIILTRTLPVDLGDEFTLAVGVAEQSWAEPEQRLAINQAGPDLYLFEDNTWARLGAFRRTERKSYEAVTISPVEPVQTRQVQFWNTINLRGIDLPTSPLEPGDALPVTFYWEAAAPLTVDLTTFAHLLDEGNNVIAQLDWVPQDRLGYLPTSAWQPHRPVIDQQTIPLPPDVPPGQYRLVVGWYYPPTGERLPLTATDRPTERTDAIQTGIVTVE